MARCFRVSSWPVTLYVFSIARWETNVWSLIPHPLQHPLTSCIIYNWCFVFCFIVCTLSIADGCRSQERHHSASVFFEMVDFPRESRWAFVVGTPCNQGFPRVLQSGVNVGSTSCLRQLWKKELGLGMVQATSKLWRLWAVHTNMVLTKSTLQSDISI